MHTIEQKLEQFLNKTLIQDIELKLEDLSTHNIRYTDPQHLIGTLFEKGSMNRSLSFQDEPDRIFIGAYSSIRSGGYMRSNIFIGRHSGIGYRCTIAAGMHNFSGVSINSDTIMSRESNYTDEELIYLNIPKNRTSTIEMNSKPVIIGNDVYLGDGIVVMPGVTIGDGAIIAANAVVTKDIPPYTVVGGVPAKVIRDRFPDKIKEQLSATRWWNKRLDILKTMPVDNVFKFIEACADQDDSVIDAIDTLSFKNN
jgi:acetyltransferase-like isoleucine patch superfamily enzyme